MHEKETPVQISNSSPRTGLRASDSEEIQSLLFPDKTGTTRLNEQLSGSEAFMAYTGSTRTNPP